VCRTPDRWRKGVEGAGVDMSSCAGTKAKTPVTIAEYMVTRAAVTKYSDETRWRESDRGRCKRGWGGVKCGPQVDT